MKIRLKVDISGSFDGRRWPGRGNTIDVPDIVGARMVANGQASAVEDVPVETATTVTADIEERSSAITTDDGPVKPKRPRGRPRKKQD